MRYKYYSMVAARVVATNKLEGGGGGGGLKPVPDMLHV